MPDTDRVRDCCFLRCKRPAEWVVIYGRTDDEYTEACSEHVGSMLTDDSEQHVYKIADHPGSVHLLIMEAFRHAT